MGKKRGRSQVKKVSDDEAFPNAALHNEEETQQSPSIPPSSSLLPAPPNLAPDLPSPKGTRLSASPQVLEVAGPSSRPETRQTSQQNSLHLRAVQLASRRPASRSPPLVPPPKGPCTTSIREAPQKATLLQKVSCLCSHTLVGRSPTFAFWRVSTLDSALWAICDNTYVIIAHTSLSDGYRYRLDTRPSAKVGLRPTSHTVHNVLVDHKFFSITFTFE